MPSTTRIPPSSRTAVPASSASGESAVPSSPDSTAGATAPATATTNSTYRAIAVTCAPTTPRTSVRPLGSRASTTRAQLLTDRCPK